MKGRTVARVPVVFMEAHMAEAMDQADMDLVVMDPVDMAVVTDTTNKKGKHG